MSQIHIHIYRGRDAETKHDPKNGQFATGSGGSAGGSSEHGSKSDKELVAHYKAQKKLVNYSGVPNKKAQAAMNSAIVEMRRRKIDKYS